MKTWQLQDAKSKFSQVINLAVNDSPQCVTKSGKVVAYIVSAETYEKEHGISLKEILLSRPHKDIELEIMRDREEPRELEL
ncbi:type II toxin-antitoxin system prevent-host-death family antitoxin [Oceanispirochaeta sp.]|uniref:type II toxin-antitoxin system prevent-host-death family antitoxin n=1 Tax=Oceanispirochaeta sp. TaxID=2035350 RepID=UPI00260B6930|nr:type II toxin-antitoxin system prevent-host-death family antitoxin [Oceanispirochaeta sp.]MDA3957985.1 type II toxin-antitoxin system prevent-host-death family antitoxin [Oceanispirochaeta sp.]